jgi:site-specific DNA recombinase
MNSRGLVGLPWGIYARLSDDKGAEQTATARQIADCRRLAADRGWVVAEAHVYEDVDLSAFKQVRRPEFERLLDDLDAGLLAGVICWKLDRLTRSHRDFERLWEIIERRGGKLVSLHEQFDTSTPAGEFTLRMMVGMARMESQNIALRLRSRLAEKREAGQPHAGGNRPYGYRADFVTVDPAEAAVMREAAARLLAGETLREVTKDLNRRGLLSSTGKPWSPPTLRRTLASPRLAGLRVHWRREPTATGRSRRVREVVGPGTWEPIFDQETHQALLALFEDPARRSQTRQPRVHLLAGLLRCGRCGGPMYVQSHGRGRPKDYRCLPPPVGRGCGGVSILAGPLEELAAQAAIAAVDGPELAAAIAGRVDQEGAARLASDQAALEELSRDYYVERRISRDEFLTARAGLETRIRTAVASLERQTRSALLAELASSETVLADTWSTLDPDRRRAILAALFESITIRPAETRGRNRFDPGRVDLTWRV